MLHTSLRGTPTSFLDPNSTALNRLIATLRGTEHTFSLPVARAALAGEFKLGGVLVGGRLPTKVFDPCRPSTLIIVSGDPGYPTPTPQPEAFPQAVRLIRWAEAVVIHGTGGELHHYEQVAAMARELRRTLLIETGTAAEAAWVALVERESLRRQREGRFFPALVWSAAPRRGFHPVREEA